MNRRHFPSTKHALANLDEINEKRFVEVHDQENLIGAINSGHPKKVVARWMVANSIHLIDYFLMFCRGNPTRSFASIPMSKDNLFIVQHIIEFDTGDLGSYTAVWNAPGPWSVRVTTPSKMLIMQPLEKLSEQNFPSKDVKMINLQTERNDLKPGLYNQTAEFVGALSSRVHKLPTISDYIKTHKLVETIYSESFDLSSDQYAKS